MVTGEHDQTTEFEDVALTTAWGGDAYLVVADGPSLTAVALPKGGTLVIGRAEDADVVLSDGKASRHHARVLVVLPLENRGSPDDAHVAEGLTAVLIDAIDSRELHVPSRGAVEASHPAGRNPLQVGRDLGAEAVVLGSVTCSDSRDIVIELRVVGTGDGLVLFAEKIECPLTAVVRAAEDASRSIARALLVERKETAPAIDDGKAIQLYLQGLHEYRGRWESSSNRSLECFRAALERAPDDPMIMAALALSLARRIAFGDDDSVVEEARTVSRRALALGRDRAEPHIAVGAVALQLSDNVGAARALRSAVAIAPHQADAHYLLGVLTTEVSSVADGLAHLYTALTLDPSLTHARWSIARWHALLGEWSRSDALFTNPPEDPQRCDDYWVCRVRSLVYNPSTERIRMCAADFARSPAFDNKVPIAATLAILQGERPAPSAFAQFANEVHPSGRRTCFVKTLLAELACLRGDLDAAVACAADAERASWVDVVWMDTCPLNAPLRGREDYRAIRERVASRAEKVAAALVGSEG